MMAMETIAIAISEMEVNESTTWKLEIKMLGIYVEVMAISVHMYMDTASRLLILSALLAIH